MCKRNFIFGSEWFFVKIYSGPKILEKILIHDLTPLLNQLHLQKHIDNFFFIRYQDPEYHIRLRMHLIGDDVNHIIKMLYRVFEAYVDNHIISKLIIDTYHREIERYGSTYIEDVEYLFAQDSTYILDYLHLHGDDDTNRWLVASQYIDSILNSCDFSLEKKIEFCEVNSSALSDEIYHNNKEVNILLNNKYREIGNKLSFGLDINHYPPKLNTYLENIKYFTDKIAADINSKHTQLLSSIIHMHINRLFRTKQRINECVIYYLLLKFYKSKRFESA